MASSPAPAPRIELKPWQESDWPLAWAWCERYYWLVGDDFSPQSETDFIDQKLQDQSVNVGVYRDGILGGVVSYNAISPVLVQAHCMFNKGKTPADSFWGWDTTLPALQLAINLAWKMGYRKMWCLVFAHNKLMHNLMHKLGFTVEGLLLNHDQQHGKPVHVVSYGLYREDV